MLEYKGIATVIMKCMNVAGLGKNVIISDGKMKVIRGILHSEYKTNIPESFIYKTIEWRRNEIRDLEKYVLTREVKINTLNSLKLFLGLSTTEEAEANG